MPVKSVEEYISCHSYWEEELRQLHEMMLTTELEPTIKWGAPVYTIDGKNVVGIGAFKNHYGIWFFNGALLKKNTALLVNAQEGKTKALRQIKFEKGDEINTSILLPYIKEAIQNQKEGIEIKPAKQKELIVPPELSSAFKKDPELKSAFKKLSPGKQREYADHISEAKREATRQSRLEKVIPMIKSGVGLNDKYKNC
ncbi:uncharacterized protein YdeI (YjbR/CyaY-like superfamily) [Christiangramia gaetbulicola]|uniref:Uncharacterized protein YdeI (YjbR/CyaY-like superfamily) n=1 Tax=Christiangramia gaetbulicola TaxID=703340 RepID=A0A2T6AEH9_9FLAO|nr:YdeI/OmpD-associated family protein [Christiangramia gaetbulicola]PTX42223.1 uncharacterized protein YdeI (YjbR/CyaY-like superfamily) [Christiangramia gaetbulicola]